MVSSTRTAPSLTHAYVFQQVHIGWYARILMLFQLDKNTQPHPASAMTWVDAISWFKEKAPGGAFSFFTVSACSLNSRTLCANSHFRSVWRALCLVCTLLRAQVGPHQILVLCAVWLWCASRLPHSKSARNSPASKEKGLDRMDSRRTRYKFAHNNDRI